MAFRIWTGVAIFIHLSWNKFYCQVLLNLQYLIKDLLLFDISISGKSKGSGGGNRAMARPVPEWQKGIKGRY